MNRRQLLVVLATLGLTAGISVMANRGETALRPVYHSPYLMAVAPDGSVAYVSDYTADAVVTVDLKTGKPGSTIPVAGPGALVLSPDGRTLYVTNTREDKVVALDLPSAKMRASVVVGRRPLGLALSKDGSRLFVCNSFTNDVSLIDTATMLESGRIKVIREPRFCALSPDEQTLVVTNHLPNGSNMDDSLGTEVSLINLTDKSVTNIKLSLGSTDVGQVCCSPDGKWAYVPHVLARWLVPPTQLDRGWVSTNALTIIDLQNKKRLNTVLLDDLDRGAANPFSAVLTADGSRLFVSHSGTNEVSVIDTAKLLQMIADRPADSRVALEDDLTAVYRSGARKRLKCGGVGPRGVAPVEGGVLVANYFSGNLTKLELERGKILMTIPLGEQPPADDVRKGEQMFHDATLCFQGWHSCATCHPDGRSDGLAWDLLNDGIGNWKNAKSLLLSDKTPPAMAHGVRASMEAANAAGFKFILFHVPTDEEIRCVGAYINSMQPERSPYLRPDGSLTEAAQRGKEIFERQEVQCAECHPAPLYTDLNTYDVGTKGKYDKAGEFDTPTLIECWRTAPFLHDGSAVTMREVLKDRNEKEWHGHVSQLSEQELNDLIEYVMSL